MMPESRVSRRPRDGEPVRSGYPVRKRAGQTGRSAAVRFEEEWSDAVRSGTAKIGLDESPTRMAASTRSEPELDALGRVAQDAERSAVDLDDVARLERE